MSHRNSPLSELGRLRLARLIVEQGWTTRSAAERFNVSATTAARWSRRYRLLGEAGMADRSSRPRRSPRRTPTRTERRIIKVRVLRRWGPARIGFLLGLHPSTVHRVLSRYRLARLAWLDRSSGQVVRRYQWQRPGDLIHVDIKKLGRIPDGGGWRALGRAEGRRGRRRGAGYWYLHAAVDDCSRLAYCELLPDEQGATAAGFWARAAAWYAERGITARRVLTDNGACYRSRAFAAALAAAPDPAAHRRTRPYRPQTNGKVCEDFSLARRWPGLTPVKV